MAKKLVSLAAAGALALGAVAATGSAQAQTVYAGYDYGYGPGYYNSIADAGPLGLVLAPFALAAGVLGATTGLVAAPFTGGYYGGYTGDFAGYYGDAWYDRGYYTDAAYYNASPGWVYSNGAPGVYIAKYKGKPQRKHLK